MTRSIVCHSVGRRLSPAASSVAAARVKLVDDPLVRVSAGVIRQGIGAPVPELEISAGVRSGGPVGAHGRYAPWMQSSLRGEVRPAVVATSRIEEE